MSESKDKTVTITIPARLEGLIREAARQIDVTHGSVPALEALLLHLVERGARACATYSSSEDFRSVASISVAELADVLGIADLEATRRSCRESKERHEKVGEIAKELFKDVEGLRQVNTQTRIGTAKQMQELSDELSNALAHHPELALVVAVAFVDTRRGSYRPLSAVN